MDINTYLESLYIQEDVAYIMESDLKTALSKLSPVSKTKNLLSSFSKVLDDKIPVKSLKKIQLKTKFIPKFKTTSVDKYLTSKYSEYKSMKSLSKTILTNSLPNISKESNETASIFLSISTLYMKKGEKNLKPKDRLKNNTKDFVLRVRNFMDSNDDQVKEDGFSKEDLPDLAVAWAIVSMATAIAIGLGTGIISVAFAFAGFLPWGMLLIVVVAALALLVKVLGG